MRSAQILFTLAANIALTGCASLTKHLPDPSPLLIASCPKLTPLSDDTFGATSSKLVEVTGIYYQCRAAAGIQ